MGSLVLPAALDVFDKLRDGCAIKPAVAFLGAVAAAGECYLDWFAWESSGRTRLGRRSGLLLSRFLIASKGTVTEPAVLIARASRTFTPRNLACAPGSVLVLTIFRAPFLQGYDHQASFHHELAGAIQHEAVFARLRKDQTLKREHRFHDHPWV